MDLTSPYFPVRVKQEPADEGYGTPHFDQSMYASGSYMKPEPASSAYSHTIAEADSAGPPLDMLVQKKKGKKKRIKRENDKGEMPKERKKVDRFNGMSEEEVAKRTLPDHLVPNLDIVVVGINPGLFAAYKGHHYAGPGNHFWKCLYLSGLIPEPMTSDDDYHLLEHGVGFTNMVERTTRGSADLTRKEIKEGAKILLKKLQKYRPKIAVFNGKGIYEIFSGKKNFDFGKQPDLIEGTATIIFVMPSSSARCAQLPRAIDKVPFYQALKKLRDHMNGKLPDLKDEEVTFPDVKLKIEPDDGLKTEPVDIKEEPESNGRSHELDSTAEVRISAATSMEDEERPKAKKKKKYTPKKKKEEVENGQQAAFAEDSNYMRVRVKQEKPDNVMYHGYPQQGAGCPYTGGYPPPPAHSGHFYANPPNSIQFGSYSAPPPAGHPNSFVSSGSLNQLESFVDQIPNIGPPGLQSQTCYQSSAQYSSSMPNYQQPPPPLAHKQPESAYPSSGSSYSPPHSAFAPTSYNQPPDQFLSSPQSYSGGDDGYQRRSASPVYTDLDSVQVKQERIDPCYGAY